MLKLSFAIVLFILGYLPIFAMEPEFFESTAAKSKSKCGAFAKIPSTGEILASEESKATSAKHLFNKDPFEFMSAPQISLTLVEEWLKMDPSAPIKARRDFLKTGEVLSAQAGGMGYTFVHRLKSTGRVHRYKGEFPELKGFHSNVIIDFAKEADLASKAGLIGVGPESTYLGDVDLLRMENIEGINLEQFGQSVLPNLSETARIGWIERLAESTNKNLEKLHESGTVHLDLNPRNILIPTAKNDGTKTWIIDYGLAQRIGSLPKVHRDKGSSFYPGTQKFQGSNSKAGKPGIADDYEALVRILIDLTQGNNVPSPLYETPFFRERPNLRRLSYLLMESTTSESPNAAADLNQLFKIALKETPTEQEQEIFDTKFLEEFNKRSNDQKLRLLLSDPALGSSLSRFRKQIESEVPQIIAAGASGNGLVWDATTGKLSRPPPPPNPWKGITIIMESNHARYKAQLDLNLLEFPIQIIPSR